MRKEDGGGGKRKLVWGGGGGGTKGGGGGGGGGTKREREIRGGGYITSNGRIKCFILKQCRRVNAVVVTDARVKIYQVEPVPNISRIL